MHGGDNLFSRLHQLITNAREVGSVPQAMEDASIVTIYKKDDSALVVHSAEEMQKIVDAFSDASKKFGLKINIQEDRDAVPTQLYKNPRGGYHG
ncbi:hypothetical protein NP493_1532g01040 [Ridgeia piscesae]|uniref:Uncharacterized protein n=1 Tax=Ridgeia piscesae TaxID=27915 RepID=A0AAD9K1B3_RIDPI|nr:hypothetical protein NP493_1532g01040 [Ridgeia piscesae]